MLKLLPYMPYNYVSNQASEPHIPSPASPGHYFPCTRHTLIHMHTRIHKYIIHKDSYTGIACLETDVHTCTYTHTRAHAGTAHTRTLCFPPTLLYYLSMWVGSWVSSYSAPPLASHAVRGFQLKDQLETNVGTLLGHLYPRCIEER